MSQGGAAQDQHVAWSDLPLLLVALLPMIVFILMPVLIRNLTVLFRIFNPNLGFPITSEDFLGVLHHILCIGQQQKRAGETSSYLR